MDKAGGFIDNMLEILLHFHNSCATIHLIRKFTAVRNPNKKVYDGNKHAQDIQPNEADLADLP